MRDNISILLSLVPRYGEMLLGVGCIALENREELLEDGEAREEVKTYLLEEAPKARTIIGISESSEFQEIMYEYIGKYVAIGMVRDKIEKDKKVNICLLDFFCKSIWPILVKRYMDTIYEGIDKVIIPIRVKKNVYLTIYEGDNLNLFFAELKEFLLYNCIIISKWVVQENGDILMDLMIPIPPHRSFY